jgi:hypothetical protein
MKKLILLILLNCTLLSIARSQITCDPEKDDFFNPIKEGVIFRTNPSINAPIAFKSPSPDHIYLKCVEDGFQNGFVKVKVHLNYLCFGERGLNENLSFLYEKIIEEYNDEITFKDFYKAISDSTKMKRLYEVLSEDEDNTWFKNFSTNYKYDMSTYQGFYDYWIAYDKNKSDDLFIVENHERIVYVHKSVINNNRGIALPYGSDQEYFEKLYKDKIQQLVELEYNNSCKYNPYELYAYVEKLTLNYIEKQEYFKAIQLLNKHNSYFASLDVQPKIDYLIMVASYHDNNYKAALELGSKLINLYKAKKIKNQKEYYERDNIDLSEVYGYVISCCLNVNQHLKALSLSEECRKNNSLKFSELTQFYASALVALNRKDEACSFLNKEYLKGNEEARELIKNLCN